jgi:alkylation response protein AidB-like acyl-CoA dehydrogenase
MSVTDVRSLFDAVGRLTPQIRACAEEIEAARELPRPLFEALADAKLFHLAFPRNLGGLELDLPTYIQVIEELGKADASTAWAINQGAIFATYAARMPPEAARAIWIDTPRSVVSNTPSPSARAVVVPGGFRVTGEQGFSTGCRHASWVASHARIFENGQPRMDKDGQPETRYLFVPVAEAELLDTWHVRGLRGTGTHHFAVHDVFVPEERSRCTGFPARCCLPRAMPRSRWAWLGPAWTPLSSWPGPRPRGRRPGSCASSPWCRQTSVWPRSSSALCAPS